MSEKEVSTEDPIIIVGGGPAGLFAAELLLKKGHHVHLYEKNSGMGKKFLIAGKGGLNLTHSEPIDLFISRYDSAKPRLEKSIREFSPTDLRAWCESHGVETFIGSSGRVFPKNLGAGEILVHWTNELKKDSRFQLHLKHKFVGLKEDKSITFESEGKEVVIKAKKIVFGLGGKSWAKTGSDGDWVHIFQNLEIFVAPFRPSNCGFEVSWSDTFKEKCDSVPLKNVEISFQNFTSKGEVMLTTYGIEGGSIYALSRFMRDEIDKNEKAQLILDLLPNLTPEEILNKLNKSQGRNSRSNHLRKVLKLSPQAISLIWEVLPKEVVQENEKLSLHLKKLEIPLIKTRPLDEAISSAGGVAFSELDENFQLKKIPGVFLMGEMVDWEAPTGGYLLQACFSMAFQIAKNF